MPVPYSLAIFDFDGTLADSWRLMGTAIIEGAIMVAVVMFGAFITIRGRPAGATP